MAEERVIDLTNSSDENSNVSEKGFRLNAIQVGLTYSCPTNMEENPITSKDQILAVLETVSSIALSQYLISVERHESGKKHYHVYARWERKLDIRNAERTFDCMGVHPNICSGKVGAAWKNYVAKGGDYITNFYVPKVTKYAEALAQESVSEALAILAANHPRDYLLQRDRLKANLEAHQLSKRPRVQRVLEPLNEYGEYVKSMVLAEWKTLAIILHGRTNLGKTCFAKRLGEFPYLISHMDQLRNIPPETTHLVFDDMSFAHLPRSAILHLVDLEEDRMIHVRYSTALVPSGLPRLFTTNLRHLFGFDGEGPGSTSRLFDEAIARRISFIDLENKLW